MVTSQTHDPEIITAGAKSQGSPRKPADRSVQQVAKKSYGFLSTWRLPERLHSRIWYNMKRRLFRDFASNHTDFLVWQEYQVRCEQVRVNHTEFLKQAEHEYLIRRLKWLDNQGITAIMAFANYKSGGKTVSLLLVLSTLAEHTRRVCIASPATSNNATATLAIYSGTADYRCDTIQELADRLDSIRNHQDLDAGLAITDAGVRIVGEDMADANKVDNDYRLKTFVQVLLGVVPHVRYVGLDLGNDNIHRDSIGLVAPRLAHVLNFCFPDKDVILEKTIQGTVRGYNSDRTRFDDLAAMLKNSGLSEEEMFDINPEDVAKTGFNVSTLDKVAHSVVIANRAGEDDIVDFGSVMSPDQSANAEATPVWTGVGVKVPLDPHLDTKQSLVRQAPFSLANVSQETRRAGLLAAIANLESAAHVQGIDISGVPQFDPPPVPEVEFPFSDMSEADRKELS